MSSSTDITEPPTERDNSRVREASRAVAWNAVLSVATTFFGMAATILTVRLLTISQYGDFTVAANYLRFVALLSLFTLDAALMRYVPEYRARGDRRGLVNLIWKVMGVHAVVWFVLTIATVTASSWLSGFNKADLNLLMLTGAVVILPSVVSVSLQAVLTSFFAVRIQAIGTVMGGCLQLFCLWLFITRLGWGGPGAMIAQLGMSGFLVLLFVWQIRKLPLPHQKGEYRPVALKRLLGFSLPYVINGVAGVVFLRQSEVLFLRPFWGSAITATYAYAYTVAQRFLEFVPTALYGVGNVLSATAFLEGREQLARVMNIYWRITAIAITAVSLGGFALGDRLAPLLFGSKAAEAGYYAGILFLTEATIIFVNPYNFVMRAEEKTWLSFWLSPPAAIISLGMDWLLIPKYGLHGALVATSVSFFLVTLLQFFVFRREFPYLRLPWEYIIRCYLASLPMLLAIPVKTMLHGPAGLIGGLLTCAIVWGISARAWRLLGPDESDLLIRSGLPGSAAVVRILCR